MRQLVSASLRHHARRYVATVVAVAIAIAFVAAALVFGGALSFGIKQQIAGQYQGSSAVVQGWSDDDSWDLRDAALVADEVPGVTGTYLLTYAGLRVERGGQGEEWLSATLVPGGHLGAVNLEEGTLPGSSLEIVLSSSAAERMDVGVGSQLPLLADRYGWDEDGADADSEALAPVDVTISGIAESPKNSVAVVGTDAWVSPELLDQLSPGWMASEVLVAGSSDNPTRAEQETLQTALAGAFEDAGMTGISVETTYQVVDRQLEAINSSQAVLTAMLLLFPVIAGVVAMIVVSTTFQVIFRQRERELALLRVIGATGRQVRRLMMLESAAVGLIGSVVGLLIGIAAGVGIAVAAGVVPSSGEALSGVTWQQAVLLLMIGTVFTSLAGYRPALRASRVSPISALAGNVQTVKTISRRSRIVGAVAATFTVGLGVVTWVQANGPEDSKESNFLLVLLLAVLTVAAVITMVAAMLPLATRSLGRLGKSESYRLAAANSARNPGRTGATGIAIFIGVALIAMVTLGAQSLRATAHAALDRQAPIDLVVTTTDQALTTAQIDALERIEGIQELSVISGLPATATWVSDGGQWEGVALDNSDIGRVLRGEMPDIGDGQVLMPWNESGQPEPVSLCSEMTCVDVEGIPSGSLVDTSRFVTTPQVIEALGGEARPMQVWMQLQNPDDYPKVLSAIESVGPELQVEGQVALRAALDQIVNILVMVIVALLAVSVLVALVGIGNTLSLSVAERIKENGLLRALGMTKKQVRSMLSWEALLIAAVSTVAGLAVGGYFGVVGFEALPIGISDSSRIIQVPWIQWAAIAGVAVGAALLASVIPGRRASRVSPVEALAAE